MNQLEITAAIKAAKEAITTLTVHRSKGLSNHAAACDLAIKQAEATQARQEAAQGLIDANEEIRGRNNKGQG